MPKLWFSQRSFVMILMTIINAVRTTIMLNSHFNKFIRIAHVLLETLPLWRHGQQGEGVCREVYTMVWPRGCLSIFGRSQGSDWPTI